MVSFLCTKIQRVLEEYCSMKKSSYHSNRWRRGNATIDKSLVPQTDDDSD